VARDYAGLDRLALESELKRLKGELEDLEDAIAFNLINTSAHIPGKHVRRDEELLRGLKEEVAAIEKMLTDKDDL
jgi:hypothetical protein